MKHIVIALAGLFDRPDHPQNNTTPLEQASTPALDRLASGSSVGLVRTVPRHFLLPGNAGAMSLLGLTPEALPECRAAARLYGSGLSMKIDDAVMNCCFVSLSQAEEFEKRKVLCVSPPLSPQDTKALTESLNDITDRSLFEFRTGSDGSCFLLWHKGESSPGTMYSPQSALNCEVEQFLPSGVFTQPLTDLMKKSALMLSSHPVNIALKAEGKDCADGIWLWGPCAKPRLPSYESSHGIKAAAVSTGSYFSGLARLMGLKTVTYGKDDSDRSLSKRADKAAALAKSGYELVYLYDDTLTLCSSRSERIKAIESIDSNLISQIYNKLTQTKEPFRLLVTADNAYPTGLSMPTLEAVPYLLYDSQRPRKNHIPFNEDIPHEHFIPDGKTLLNLLLKPSSDKKL